MSITKVAEVAEVINSELTVEVEGLGTVRAHMRNGELHSMTFGENGRAWLRVVRDNDGQFVTIATMITHDGERKFKVTFEDNGNGQELVLTDPES